MFRIKTNIKWFITSEWKTNEMVFGVHRQIFVCKRNHIDDTAASAVANCVHVLHKKAKSHSLRSPFHIQERKNWTHSIGRIIFNIRPNKFCQALNAFAIDSQLQIPSTLFLFNCVSNLNGSMRCARTFHHWDALLWLGVASGWGSGAIVTGERVEAREVTLFRRVMNDDECEICRKLFSIVCTAALCWMYVSTVLAYGIVNYVWSIALPHSVGSFFRRLPRLVCSTGPFSA